MRLLTLAALSVIGTGAAYGSGIASGRAPDPNLPAASWAPRDTGDSLWRRGRIAISDEDWGRAAEAFRAIVERHPASVYAGDALYWEAFALQRSGRLSDLRRAQTALEKQKADYPKAATYTSGESSTLLARVTGRLARSGDREAAEVVSEMASAMAELGPAIAASVSAAMQGVAVAVPLTEREVAQVQRETLRAQREMQQALGETQRDALRDALRVQLGRRPTDSRDVPPGCEGAVDDERIEALNALMQMNGEQALPILRRVLERRDKCSELLRRKAVFLVSQMHSEEAVDILLNAAKTDPDRPTREAAVFWLSQTHSARAVEVLEQILLTEPPDEELQKKALFSLSQNRTERAHRVIRDFARRREASEEVRAEAIFWLGQGGGDQNAAFLREMFPTLQEAELREKVLVSIARHRSPENSRFLLEQAKDRSLSGDMRKTALYWAGQSGAETRELAEIYDTAGDDVELRKQVIFVLSQRKDEPAVDKLLDVARKEPDRELRRQAIFWLGQSRDPRVAKLLEEIIGK